MERRPPAPTVTVTADVPRVTVPGSATLSGAGTSEKLDNTPPAPPPAAPSELLLVPAPDPPPPITRKSAPVIGDPVVFVKVPDPKKTCTVFPAIGDGEVGAYDVIEPPVAFAEVTDAI
tara:strand:+ start:693 stop:1046 length:354 start_codon:yes stop_codon:yes gene_type:complete